MFIRKALLVLMAGSTVALLPVTEAFASHSFANYHYGSRTGCSVAGLQNTCNAEVTLYVHSGPSHCSGSGATYTCSIDIDCWGSSSSSLTAGSGALACPYVGGDACPITGATGGSCSTDVGSGTVSILVNTCRYITATQTTTNALGTVTASATAHICVDPTGPDDF